MAEGGYYEIPDELLKSLDCPICKERYRNPKIVDCTHVFCLDCLQNLIETDPRNFPPCPVCRKPINVPAKGVRAYQTQTFYADVIQCLETQNQSRSCGKIDNSPKGAELNVQEYSNLTRRPSKCKKHCPEKSEYFCNTCRIAHCKKCSSSDHIDHEVQSLHTAALDAKKKLIDIQKSLQEYMGESKDAEDDILSLTEAFGSKAVFTKVQIESEFNKIVQFVNEKKMKLLNDVHDIEVKTKKRLENELEEIQIKEVRAKTLDEFANNIVKYGSDSEAVNFENIIIQNCNKLQEDIIRRYGKGFRLDLQFSLEEKITETLNGEIGKSVTSQHLSAWPKRKNLDTLTQEDQKHLEIKVTHPAWQLFPCRRSKVFANMLQAQYRLGAFKLCPLTGKIATAWIKTKNIVKSLTVSGMFSRQFSGSWSSSAEKTTAIKTFNSCLEIAIFDEKEEEPQTVSLDNVSDITEVRLAINEDGLVQIALYPWSTVLDESQKRGSVKRQNNDGDIMYIATVPEGRGSLKEGELRKIDILTYTQDHQSENILFELTKKGYLAVHHPSFPMVFLYSPSGEKRATKLDSKETKIVGLCESSHDGILVVSVKGPGPFMCEEYSHDCAIKHSFCVQSSLTSNTLAPEFVTACYDTRGNVVLHYRKDGHDHLSLISSSERKEEILYKPDMFHMVDQMAVLPHGRICLFDKKECVLMTLQYLQ